MTDEQKETIYQMKQLKVIRDGLEKFSRNKGVDEEYIEQAEESLRQAMYQLQYKIGRQMYEEHVLGEGKAQESKTEDEYKDVPF